MRRPLLLVAWVLELWLVLAGALVLALWFWSGSEGSLSSTLQLATRALPPGHQLLVEDARGSLRSGGRIARLRWESRGLSVDARQIDFLWQPWALLERRLVFERLHLGEVTIDDRSPASAEPVQELLLPLRLEAAVSADRMRWAGPAGLQADAVVGTYRYDGVRHDVLLRSAQVAQGRYQGRATLLARAPLTLELRLQGQVQVPVGARRIALDASASLQGPLAGRQDTLQLVADLQPGPASTGLPDSTQAMRAHVSARIAPWAAQPVLEAQARYSQLDLAALWPDAPQTRLTGDAQVQPRAAGWLASLRLVNAAAGPWDRHQLPVNKAQAVVALETGSWRIASLQADSAGGSIDVQGRLDHAGASAAVTRWEGSARLSAVNPALLHSQLAPARLNGSIEARSEGRAILFDASLQPAGAQPAASPLAGLRLQRASAKGRWADGWWRLQDLLLQTDDASVTGPLDVHPGLRSARGQLQWTLPGGQGRLGGELAPQDGGGEATLDVTDASRLVAWVRRLPQWPAGWTLPDLQGRADLALTWQGGWQSLLTGVGTPARIQALLRVPTLMPRTTAAGPAAAWHMQAARFDIAGTPGALALSSSGDVQVGMRRFAVQARAEGGRGPAGDWRMTLQTLQADMRDNQRPGVWTLALRQPLLLEWLSGPAGGSLRTGTADAQLTGPLPGVAPVQLQPILWSPAGGGRLSSLGAVRGMRMEWLTLLGDLPLASLGLSGDMLFDGTWDLAAADTLKLRASLERRSGDIRVLAENLGGGPDAGTVVDAGVREARIALAIDGDAVTAAMRWDSERAGNAQADITTRLEHRAGGWAWPASAPLGGTVKARLPQVGVWSVLAPPGWRMRGTLDAGLVVAGTREGPQWSGQIQADGLALRSVVDGIEFGNGRLRARMQGTRLVIDEFSLQGAGGAAGGTLQATGTALWMPAAGADTGAMARVQIDLDATARALRVSARADRRLVVSGTLQARLRNARLDVQGALKADQALFVLPEETAPQLGDDVVVRSSRSAAPLERAGATPGAAAPAPAGTPVRTTLALALDLGPDFQVQGRGIVTRLSGSLQLRGNAGEAPRLSGEVRTVRGTYKAYGQLLAIEQGVMRFTGAYDNPALDILAVRPNLTQRVGVQITGNAYAPRVRLFAEPELPEAEKLAWLVLGRSGANGGAEAAVLQQAAMALLGRNGQGLSGGLASALGLDELSIGAAAARSDGGTSAATVTLGKRISRDFYVAYERSLAGTLGTISIFYDLSRRFTLRASTGEQSAIDLIFTIRYD